MINIGCLIGDGGSVPTFSLEMYLLKRPAASASSRPVGSKKNILKASDLRKPVGLVSSTIAPVGQILAQNSQLIQGVVKTGGSKV